MVDNIVAKASVANMSQHVGKLKLVNPTGCKFNSLTENY